MKAICVMSGGIDSTTLLHHLIDRGEKVKAISFDYGQKHRKELDCARRTCQKINVEHKVIDISSINVLLRGNALTDDQIEVPVGEYSPEILELTVVPNRNMIFLAIAGGYAVAEKADILAIAVHSGDHAIYPDCRPEFINLFEKTLQAGNYHQIKVYAPYLKSSKTQIVAEGNRLGIDYEADTWSCYVGNEKPCGTCGTCLERAEALRAARDA